ncbi:MULTISPECIES: hypothetical protein [Sporosarcina]|uniref:Short-chain dehydrogenase n=1 Tax=Sporosarcina gallistercoris TaxID=2762245 RepID=A0ABR8PGJ4_9BACL|nr:MULTISPECIES: hypothetical protein [Sporosarcina]MBD7907291.1 hypothetical protein [Sporosarcina gallistercoris]VDG97317.1 Uncharacterised protein [Lysinibacillus sphaericus]
MFDIWAIPIGVVVAVMVIIGVLAVRKKPHYNPDGVLNRQDRSVAEPIEDHPFTLNPILWVILVAALFSVIVIFYYWASFS